MKVALNRLISAIIRTSGTQQNQPAGETAMTFFSPAALVIIAFLGVLASVCAIYSVQALRRRLSDGRAEQGD